MLGLLFLAVSALFPTGGELGTGLTAFARPSSSCDIEIQDVIQSEFGEELLVTLVRIQNAERTAAMLHEIERCASERA